ncbi:MAG: glycosyltransferase family 39 protein [Anaerolineaceae bacterium]|nr:glycosyltransferase family 39 protein [Anaerolineaceae bacterium]
MAQSENEITMPVAIDRHRTRILNETVVSTSILVVALALGVFLRIWQLNAIGYNTDEAVYTGQAAAIAGVPDLKNLFPIFRAHPLLFQFTLSLLFHFGFQDLWGRLLAVLVGMGTVLMTYFTGKALYGKTAGALAALFVAFMPYQVIVSRQVLLDGPMAFFSTVTLYTLARYGNTQRREWLYASGAAMGLTFLSKETGILMLGAIYTFLALARELRLRIIDIIIAAVIMVVVIAPFPISLSLAGGSHSGQQYLIWQLFRRPNHDWSFYLTTLPPVIGFLTLIAAAASLWLLRKQRSWQEKLLLTWIIVPFAFFELWPVKGFQYLLPISAPVAILAARLIAHWAPVIVTKTRTIYFGWLNPVLGAVIALSLVIPSWQTVQPSTSATFLAGTGGVPGGREAGQWVLANVPQNAILLAVGPSMANIIEFYGHRQTFGLAVSPNPLHRNPSYTPINNPDQQIRKATINYVVWDSFSAARSPFFADKILQYAAKYHGRIIHIQSVSVSNPDGTSVYKPVIVIFEVHP